MRIHKSIFFKKFDLKVLNTEVQNYVTNILEPLLRYRNHLGNDPILMRQLMKFWKLLFENAAHDSIGSYCRYGNEDVYVRYKQARDLAVNLVELHTRLMATLLKGNRK